MLGETFASCKLEPVTTDKSGEPTTISPSTNGSWKTTSFFLDSSGRSSFTIPLQLTFVSKNDLDAFLGANCLSCFPCNFKAQNGNDEANAETASVVGFEVKSFPVDELKPVVVEGIKVLNCNVDIDKLSTIFALEITLRASNHISSTKGAETNKIDANLEITPVLSEKHVDREQDALDVPDLRALELGAIPDHMQRESTSRVLETRLNPVKLNVTLCQAFSITVKSMSGPTQGVTLVSLIIRHSNSHSEPLTITSIDLHPGHSRLDISLQNKQRRSSVRGQFSVSKCSWWSLLL